MLDAKRPAREERHAARWAWVGGGGGLIGQLSGTESKTMYVVSKAIGEYSNRNKQRMVGPL